MSQASNKPSPTAGELQALYDGLRRISDMCSEALASLHADQHVEDVHLENVMDINGAVWALRWESGLFGGFEEPAPAPAEQASDLGTTGGAP